MPLGSHCPSRSFWRSGMSRIGRVAMKLPLDFHMEAGDNPQRDSSRPLLLQGIRGDGPAKTIPSPNLLAHYEADSNPLLWGEGACAW